MPPPLPDRYRLEVRLGRDGDIEHWLGTDLSLDRPVLIRLLGPETSERRRTAFLEAVRSAATINHQHLIQLFTADLTDDGAYAISEWPGGSTIADRLQAGDTIAVNDFVPNAAGLASALAALHAEGLVHGSIDTSAISYSVSHPAKLGGLGRVPRAHTVAEDVRDLVAALEEGLTGFRPGGPPPSEIVDGIHPQVDRILEQGWKGLLGARALSDELNAAPSLPRRVPDSPSWSRRLLLAAASLAMLAVALIGAGQLLISDDTGGITVPIDPRSAPPVAAPVATTVIVAPQTGRTLVPPLEVATVDPFGGNEENDELLAALLDDDPQTSWRSERYRDRLSLIKPGLGLGFRSDGRPKTIVLDGLTPGIQFTIGWSETPDFESMEPVYRGSNRDRIVELQVPTRVDGWWILWVTELPAGVDGERLLELGQVRFGL